VDGICCCAIFSFCSVSGRDPFELPGAREAIANGHRVGSLLDVATLMSGCYRAETRSSKRAAARLMQSHSTGVFAGIADIALCITLADSSRNYVLKSILRNIMRSAFELHGLEFASGTLFYPIAESHELCLALGPGSR